MNVKKLTDAQLLEKEKKLVQQHDDFSKLAEQTRSQIYTLYISFLIRNTEKSLGEVRTEIKERAIATAEA